MYYSFNKKKINLLTSSIIITLLQYNTKHVMYSYVAKLHTHNAVFKKEINNNNNKFLS